MRNRIPGRSCWIVCAASLWASAAPAGIPAFSGAEGAGKYTVGGRGGAVYEVTHLEDDGPGSLRDAVEASGPRTVVFRVSGTIRLLSDLKIKNPYLTVAGQTAPGQGVCIRDHQVVVQADQVILRYLRFRLGDETGVETDAIWGRYRSHIVLDHCSASWSVDETLSFYGNDSMTVQWCLVSESLYLSNHSKGAHGYGGIWGGRNASFHHNLLAHHSSRNPRFSGGETMPCENVDFRNNVIYNWGFNSAYGGEGGLINMVNNYFKPGPATKSGVRSRIVQISDANGKWHIEGNVVEGSPAVTADNWAGGVQGSYGSQAVSRSAEPHSFVPIGWETAEEAYDRVLEDAGARFPFRDPVDTRILADVRSGTATCDGTGYERLQGFADTSVVRGIIDSQADAGGWPELLSGTPPEDSDHDGMPDEWERNHGLDPYNPGDRNVLDETGYTMLELCINGPVSPSGTRVERPAARGPAEFALLSAWPNPFNPAVTVSFALPGAGPAGLAVFDVRGRLVRSLIPAGRVLAAGTHAVRWDGKDGRGTPAPSGVYIAVLTFQDRRRSIQMLLMK